MKVTFAGVGSAFTDQRYYQSNMVVTSKEGKRLLIDCGTDARFSFGELGATNSNIGQWADGVYITHLHADHIGGLEWLAFCTYFNPKSPKPKLFIVENLIDDLWNSLKAGLRSQEAKILNLESFFDVKPIAVNNSFCWENICFRPVQTIHVMDGFRIVPTFGLLFNELQNNDFKIFITADTQFCPNQIETFYKLSNIIFHDCETSPFATGVHSHYDDLKNLPNDIKNKMWLYHYNPNPKQQPLEDGFCGFVTKGQTFDF